jgi:uncharacterized protein
MAIKSMSDMQVACLKACNACAAACQTCLSKCLAEDADVLAKCITLDAACAISCTSCAEMLAGDGAMDAGMLKKCIADCNACASECEKYDFDWCKACAAACRACAKACADMLQADSGKSGGARMVRKSFFDCGFEVKSVNETGVFSGYGSVYNVTDEGNDIVASGAFAESLADWRAKGRMPALLWQHNSAEPIGVYTKMAEDKNGLLVEGQLALKTQRGAEAYELLQMKALSGLSIGFMTREDAYDHKTDVRTIKKADLWECSIVTFPMNDQARIGAVKTIEEIGDLNGAELYLREVGGVSRSEAKALVSRLLAIARREVGRSDESADLKAITALLEKQRAILGA